jgi:pimeloyl-ACP methyl ester carboxylesterase
LWCKQYVPPIASVERGRWEVPEIQLDDVTIAYEIIGEGPRVVVTPGGRFGMETAGVRDLGEALAACGFSVLLWDRPNCGGSSVSFEGESESVLWADTLGLLLRALDFYPATLAGGSAGSRVSLLTAARYPELVESLYLWWISGGTFGLMNLGLHYVGESLLAAQRHGMQAVADLRTWRRCIRRNPANRDRILAVDREAFIATMHTWIDHYIPTPESPVPGMSGADFTEIRVPVRILRSGTTDLHHPRATSEWVHKLIPQSTLSDPPWPDDEWNQCNDIALTGGSPFERWPMLAPDITEFMKDRRTQGIPT